MQDFSHDFLEYKTRTQLVKYNTLTLVSGCWMRLQTTGRFHPRFHDAPQTHCRIVTLAELWEITQVIKSIKN